MKSITLLCLMLCISLIVYAEFVPQSLMFSSFDEIEILTSYSDSLNTNCTWFNGTEIWNKNDELDYIRTVNSGHVFDICVTCGSSEYCVRCLAYNMIYNGSLVSLYEGTCLKADRAREEQLHYQAGAYEER